MKTKVVSAFCVLLLLACAGNAQERSAPTYLTLEVYPDKTRPPSFISVPRSASPRSGTWFARFRKLPGWPSDEELPVYAVDIRPVLVGDVVRVSILVFLGKRHEEEKEIAVYTLRQGEKISVEELTKFGVEPFQISLRNVTPPMANIPRVISKARSIELVSIEPNLSTLASFRLTLRNLSGKNASALVVRVMRGAHTKLSHMPHGKEGQPLILAGDVGQILELAEIEAVEKSGGYEPSYPENQVIEISTAVFEDGSFEGDVDDASRFRGFIKGRKLQLTQVLDILQGALNDESKPSAVLASLRRRASSLGLKADENSVRELATEFASSPVKPKHDLKTAVEVAMNGVRRDFLETIEQFRMKNPNPDFKDLRAWVVETKLRYETWLARL
jgi:hypothetical protein